MGQTSPHTQPSHLSDDDRPISSQERPGSTPDLDISIEARSSAVVQSSIIDRLKPS